MSFHSFLSLVWTSKRSIILICIFKLKPSQNMYGSIRTFEYNNSATLETLVGVWLKIGIDKYFPRSPLLLTLGFCLSIDLFIIVGSFPAYVQIPAYVPDVFISLNIQTILYYILSRRDTNQLHEWQRNYNEL